jgi:hypothetical protein
MSVPTAQEAYLVRTLRPMDLMGLMGHPGTWWSAAKPWERLGQDPSTPALLGSLLEHWMSTVSGSRRAWVYQEGGEVKGIAAARPRSGPHVWEVDLLLLSTEKEAEEITLPLLEEVASAGGTQGVQKVLLRLPAESPLVSLVRRIGFHPYVKERLFVHKAPHEPGPPTSELPLRPVQRRDLFPLYQLYLRTTPRPIQQIEAPTLQEWLATRERGGIAAWRREYLWEEQGTIQGWLRLQGLGRVGYLDLMVHEAGEGRALDLVLWALHRFRRRAIVCSPVPEYRVAIAHALQAAGFEETAAYKVSIKQTTVRVTQPVGVPVRA